MLYLASFRCWFYGLDTYKKYGWTAVRWTVKNWITNVTEVPYAIKHLYQRGTRGWADCDYWSLDYYIVQILVPLLKTLKKNTHGYPGLDDASTPEEWDTRLDEMIVGFEAANRLIDDEYYEIVCPDFMDREPEDGLVGRITAEEFEEMAKMREDDKKIFDKGMEVFVKWFFALWD